MPDGTAAESELPQDWKRVPSKNKYGKFSYVNVRTGRRVRAPYGAVMQDVGNVEALFSLLGVSTLVRSRLDPARMRTQPPDATLNLRSLRPPTPGVHGLRFGHLLYGAT